jgi:hypothetical protein
MPQNRRRGEGRGATTLTRETRRRSGVDEKCNQERLVEQKTLRGPHSGKTIPR